MIENVFDLDFSRLNDILLSLVPALINVGIFLYVTFFLGQKRTNNSFSVFVLLLGMWQIAEGFVRMSVTAEAAFEWAKISEVLLLLLLPFGILFILHFSEWYKKIPNNIAFPLLFLPTITLLFIGIARLDKFNVVRSESWHWVVNPAPAFITLLVYAGISVSASLMLALLWLFYAKTKSKLKRKQSLLLALGFTLPVVGGIIMEIIFPLVFGLNDIPVTVPLVTVFSITALTAITKYKFLDFSPRHQWSQIIESLNEGILIVNNEGEIMYANQIFCELTEYAYEELSGKIASKLFFDTSVHIKPIAQTISKRSGQYECQLKTRTGTAIWMIVNSSPYLDKNGKEIGTISIHTDITERKKAEEKIIENEFFLQQSQKQARIGSYRTNFVTGYWQSSESLDRIFGIDKNYDRSIVGWLEIVHPDDKQEINEYLLSEVIGKQKSFNKEYRIVTINNKQTKWVHGLGDVKFDASGNITEMTGTIQDITGRKLSEGMIRKSEENFKSFINNSQLIIYFFNAETKKITFANPTFFQVLGYLPNELDSLTIYDFINHTHEDIDSFTNQTMQAKQRKIGERVWRDRSGNVLNMYVNASYMKINNSDIIYISAEDFTDRKKMVIELAKSQQTYKSLFDKNPDGVYSFDLMGNFTSFNESVLERMGYSAEDLYKMNFLPLIVPEDRERVMGHFQKAAMGESQSYDTCLVPKTGNKIFVNITNMPIVVDNKIIGVYGIAKDLTISKQAKEALKNAEKDIRNFATHLNTVLETERSNLAREIHDELGQQLSGIKIELSVFKKQYSKNSVDEKIISDLIQEVDNTMQSMRKISTQLRPGILDSLGLIPSIQWLAEEFEKHSKVKCRLEFKVKENKFEKDISTCFFRICQESLTNISKHAEATQVIIDVNHDNYELALKISDNGKGITSKKLENPFSMGLLGMRERANIIGADFLITSNQNLGTTIQLKAKLN